MDEKPLSRAARIAGAAVGAVTLCASGPIVITIGACTFIAGIAWFVLAVLAMTVLMTYELVTGSTPTLPEFFGYELVGGAIYFGMYLGSWLVAALGAVIVLSTCAFLLLWRFAVLPFFRTLDAARRACTRP